MTVTSDIHTPSSKTKSLREMKPAKPVQAVSSLSHYSVVLCVEKKTEQYYVERWKLQIIHLMSLQDYNYFYFTLRIKG